MQCEVSLLSANEYILEELLSTDIPEKYFLTDSGELLPVATVFTEEKGMHQLIRFLFQISELPTEIFGDDHNYILELSSIRERVIDFDFLELHYPKWIEATGRENTMDEYGMLLDFIGYARQTQNKKHLFIVVTIPQLSR